MSEHVGDRIADYLADRLDIEQVRELEAHIESCPECAADLAFAQELRQKAINQGLMHLRASRMVAIVSGDSSPITPDEQQHLDTCAACQTECDWLKSNPDVETAGVPSPGEGDAPPATPAG